MYQHKRMVKKLYVKQLSRSPKDKENLLTLNIPWSQSNLAKPQAEPLAIQLFAT